LIRYLNEISRGTERNSRYIVKDLEQKKETKIEFDEIYREQENRGSYFENYLN